LVRQRQPKEGKSRQHTALSTVTKLVPTAVFQLTPFNTNWKKGGDATPLVIVEMQFSAFAATASW
jgi:hypothetical protein